MIEEAYVSFETAKLLKEKGFKEITQGYINADQEIYMCPFQQGVYELSDKRYPYPTLQMAMRWLREVHDIKVNVFYNNSTYTIEYFEPNTQTGVGKFVFIGDGYHTYEQACETAIKYCLENLI